MKKELRGAYSGKEEADLLLSNLEKLKSEGSIADAQYDMLKAEYTSMTDGAIWKVDAIKARLQEQLDGKTRELGVFRQELSNLEARFKVGQIPAETYLKREKAPKKKVAELERQVSELQTVVSSSSSADIGGVVPVKVVKPKAEKHKAEKVRLEKSKPEKPLVERKVRMGGKLKYLVWGLIGAVVVIAVVFSMPLWTVAVEVSETYTETEMKEESYTVTEEYEVSRTPRSHVLSRTRRPARGVIRYIEFHRVYESPGLEEPVRNCLCCTEYHADLVVEDQKYTLVYPDPPCSEADYVCAGLNAENCRFTVEWRASDPKTNVSVELERPGSSYFSLETGFTSNAFVEELAPSGYMEYPLSSGESFFASASTRPRCVVTDYLRPGGVRCFQPISLYIQLAYEWDDVEFETKEVTKYREVPVEVEKQRTVTKYEKVSMWKLLLGTSTATEHAD